MPVSKKKEEERLRKKRPPAKTPEAKEREMINLAMDLAEQQLRKGTASAMVITHYLKLATPSQRLEREKLIRENELLEAKTKALKSIDELKEIYSNALKAMRSYSGMGGEEVDVDNEPDNQNV